MSFVIIILSEPNIEWLRDTPEHLDVSGAPGGEKDAVCAKAAVDAVQERLDSAL